MEYSFINMFLFSHCGVSIEQMQKLFLCIENHFHVKSFLA